MKIERSPYLYLYIQMRSKGASLAEIQKRAETLGEKYSKATLCKFFKKRQNLNMKLALNVRDHFDDFADELIKEGLEAMRGCLKNLEILEQLSQALIVDVSKNPTEVTRELVPLLREIRLTRMDMTESAEKLANIRSKRSEDEQVEAMKRAINKALPPEYVQTLLEAYEEELKV